MKNKKYILAILLLTVGTSVNAKAMEFEDRIQTRLVPLFSVAGYITSIKDGVDDPVCPFKILIGEEKMETAECNLLGQPSHYTAKFSLKRTDEKGVYTLTKETFVMQNGIPKDRYSRQEEKPATQFKLSSKTFKIFDSR